MKSPVGHFFFVNYNSKRKAFIEVIIFFLLEKKICQFCTEKICIMNKSSILYLPTPKTNFPIIPNL